MTFRTLGDKSRLVDRVVDEIETMIVDGLLKPGDKLPPERELAVQLGVSRTVVRGAIHILFAKGLLDSRPGVGTIVRKMTRGPIIDSLNLLIQTSTDGISFNHVYQIRLILEAEIAGMAAEQATEEDIDRLHTVMLDMKALQSDPKQLAAKDVDFHRTLAEMTGNPLLVVFVDLIRDMMQSYSEQVIPHINPQNSMLPDHERIVACVANHDVAGARQAMHDHLKQILENYETVFGRTGVQLNQTGIRIYSRE